MKLGLRLRREQQVEQVGARVERRESGEGLDPLRIPKRPGRALEMLLWWDG